VGRIERGRERERRSEESAESVAGSVEGTEIRQDSTMITARASVLQAAAAVSFIGTSTMFHFTVKKNKVLTQKHSI
jgi:hypothetical protein